MQHFGVSIVIALLTTLAACSGDDAPASQTAVARNFDELARAITGCADMLRDCKGDDAGPSSALECRDEFIACRSGAGKSAEDALAKEISDCQDRAIDCRADASSDATETRCAQTLRTCIGEAQSDGNDRSIRDAGEPNSNAPTYQCFGQLRECVTDSGSPQKCAAEARACVILAVGDPPVIRRPQVVPPSDAGVRDPQAGGTGGDTGARAGTGGAAAVPRAGAGGSAAADSGEEATGDVTAMCLAEHEACLMRGEKPMTCAKDQRKCMKEGS